MLTITRNTIRPDSSASADETIRGAFIGFTIEGGPIVRFTNDYSLDIPEDAELLGRSDETGTVVAFQKDSLRFLTNDEEQDQEQDSDAKKIASESSKIV